MQSLKRSIEKLTQRTYEDERLIRALRKKLQEQEDIINALKDQNESIKIDYGLLERKYEMNVENQKQHNLPNNNPSFDENNTHDERRNAADAHNRAMDFDIDPSSDEWQVNEETVETERKHSTKSGSNKHKKRKTRHNRPKRETKSQPITSQTVNSDKTRRIHLKKETQVQSISPQSINSHRGVSAADLKALLKNAQNMNEEARNLKEAKRIYSF